MKKQSLDSVQSYVDWNQTRAEQSHNEDSIAAVDVHPPFDDCEHCRDKLKCITNARSVFSICRRNQAISDTLIKEIEWENITMFVVVLDLDGNFLTSAIAQLFIRYQWPLLEMFSLSNNLIDMKGSLMLGHHLRSPRLRILDLSGNDIKDDGFIVLLGGGWPNLQFLRLRCIAIMNAFDSSPSLSLNNWSKLRQLQLSENKISRAGTKAIISGDFSFLEEVLMDNCRLDDAAAVQLKKGRWPFLTRISLRNNVITNYGAKHLGEGNWSRLRSLGLTFDGRLINGLRIFSKVAERTLQKDGEMFEKWREPITHKNVNNDLRVIEYFQYEQKLLKKAMEE